MVTIEGILPAGFEFEGKAHRRFEIRPRLVRVISGSASLPAR